jgi:hypothetical protein
MNLMLINVSTRRFGRAVRLPEGDIAAAPGTACRSRRCRAGSWRYRPSERANGWPPLSGLDLLAIQIDGMHVTGELTLLAAAAVVQALLDNLIERCKQLPILRAALAAHQSKYANETRLETDVLAA